MIDGTRSSADALDRLQMVPNRMLARPAGSASHPAGTLAEVSTRAAIQIASGMVMDTRNRLSGNPPVFRWTMVSRQASACVSDV